MYIAGLVSKILVRLRCETVKKLFKANYALYLTKDIGFLNNAIVTEFEQISFATKMFASVLMTLIFAALSPKRLIKRS